MGHPQVPPLLLKQLTTPPLLVVLPHLEVRWYPYVNMLPVQGMLPTAPAEGTTWRHRKGQQQLVQALPVLERARVLGQEVVQPKMSQGKQKLDFFPFGWRQRLVRHCISRLTSRQVHSEVQLRQLLEEVVV